MIKGVKAPDYLVDFVLDVAQARPEYESSAEYLMTRYDPVEGLFLYELSEAGSLREALKDIRRVAVVCRKGLVDSQIASALTSLRGLSSNGTRKGAYKAADTKRDKKDRFLAEVEFEDASLVPLAKKLYQKIPLKPPGQQSRLEYFLQYVDENPDLKTQAMEDRASENLKAALREEEEYYSDYYHEEDNYPQERDWYDPEGEEHLEYLDDVSQEESLDLSEDSANIGAYLEDILTPKEYAMLRRVISREGLSNRELQCFYRAARQKKMRSNGRWRIWHR